MQQNPPEPLAVYQETRFGMQQGREPNLPAYQRYGAGGAAPPMINGQQMTHTAGNNSGNRERKMVGRYLGSGPGPAMIPETIINVSVG